MVRSGLAHDSPLGMALGRVPSGLYILTVRQNGHATGMLASWVQQAGFEPPMVTVALQSGRYIVDWVRSSGRFTLNQIPVGQKALLRHFARGFAPEATAFNGIGLREETTAGPVLADASAWLDVRVSGEIASGDHRIILGEVVAGALLDTVAEPMLHIRHNGFHY